MAYVGTRQGTVVGLRLADGAKLWSASLGHGPVDGVALSDGRLVVTAGTWVGALLPAPEAPGQLALAKHGKAADLTWAAPAANGSALSAYRIFRRRATDFAQVALVPAASASFADGLLPGDVGYAVSAIAANGAESARSAEVTTSKGAPLLQRVTLSPGVLDSRSGVLRVNVSLRDAARVTWTVLDAEGRALTDERSVLLPRGEATLEWDGADRSGRPTEPGVYRVSLTAKADADEDALARAFPVNWTFDGGSSALGGPLAGINGGGQAASAGGGPSTGSGSPASGGGTSGDGSSTGGGNNGVRDHGQGEGLDGHGQGNGQGADNCKK